MLRHVATVIASAWSEKPSSKSAPISAEIATGYRNKPEQALAGKHVATDAGGDIITMLSNITPSQAEGSGPS